MSLPPKYCRYSLEQETTWSSFIALTQNLGSKTGLGGMTLGLKKQILASYLSNVPRSYLLTFSVCSDSSQWLSLHCYSLLAQIFIQASFKGFILFLLGFLIPSHLSKRPLDICYFASVVLWGGGNPALKRYIFFFSLLFILLIFFKWS